MIPIMEQMEYDETHQLERAKHGGAEYMVEMVVRTQYNQ